MGQFSTEIYNPPGSTLSGNQQLGRTSFEALREGQLGGILPSVQSEP